MAKHERHYLVLVIPDGPHTDSHYLGSDMQLYSAYSRSYGGASIQYRTKALARQSMRQFLTQERKSGALVRRVATDGNAPDYEVQRKNGQVLTIWLNGWCDTESTVLGDCDYCAPRPKTAD